MKLFKNLKPSEKFIVVLHNFIKKLIIINYFNRYNALVSLYKYEWSSIWRTVILNNVAICVDSLVSFFKTFNVNLLVQKFLCLMILCLGAARCG